MKISYKEFQAEVPPPHIIKSLDRTEVSMNARKLAAQFAAYAWYEEVRTGHHSKREATRFAKRNWQPFEALVPEGLGRLLLDASRPRGKKAKELVAAE